jgi:hypothetical protein
MPSHAGPPSAPIAAALTAAYRAAATQEEAAWQQLVAYRNHLTETLTTSGLGEGGARRLIAAIEGKRRIETADNKAIEALTRLAAAVDPDAVGGWHQAARAFHDASDRAFRAATELADIAGPETRIAVEAQAEMGELRTELLSIAARLNPTLDIRFAREMYGEGAALLASGASSTDRTAVAGMYEPLYHMATISLDRRFNALDTTFHEGFHSVEGVLTPAERAVLERAFPPQGQMTTSERCAIAFAIWSQRVKRVEEMGLGSDARSVRNSFRKMAVWNGRSRQAMLGRGMERAEAVFEKVYGGEVGRRALEVAQRGRPGKAAASLGQTSELIVVPAPSVQALPVLLGAVADTLEAEGIPCRAGLSHSTGLVDGPTISLHVDPADAQTVWETVSVLPGVGRVWEKDCLNEWDSRLAEFYKEKQPQIVWGVRAAATALEKQAETAEHPVHKAELLGEVQTLHEQAKSHDLKAFISALSAGDDAGAGFIGWTSLREQMCEKVGMIPIKEFFPEIAVKVDPERLSAQAFESGFMQGRAGADEQIQTEARRGRSAAMIAGVAGAVGGALVTHAVPVLAQAAGVTYSVSRAMTAAVERAEELAREQGRSTLEIPTQAALTKDDLVKAPLGRDGAPPPRLSIGAKPIKRGGGVSL